MTICTACKGNDVSIVFLPCGHLVTCPDCAPSFRYCTVCSLVIKGTVRTYRSQIFSKRSCCSCKTNTCYYLSLLWLPCNSYIFTQVQAVILGRIPRAVSRNRTKPLRSLRTVSVSKGDWRTTTLACRKMRIIETVYIHTNLFHFIINLFQRVSLRTSYSSYY